MHIYSTQYIYIITIYIYYYICNYMYMCNTYDYYYIYIWYVFYIYIYYIYIYLAAETCSCQIYEKLVNIQLQNIPTQHFLMFKFQQNPLKHQGETSSPEIITKGSTGPKFGQQTYTITASSWYDIIMFANKNWSHRLNVSVDRFSLVILDAMIRRAYRESKLLSQDRRDDFQRNFRSQGFAV